MSSCFCGQLPLLLLVSSHGVNHENDGKQRCEGHDFHPSLSQSPTTLASHVSNARAKTISVVTCTTTVSYHAVDDKKTSGQKEKPPAPVDAEDNYEKVGTMCAICLENCYLNQRSFYTHSCCGRDDEFGCTTRFCKECVQMFIKPIFGGRLLHAEYTRCRELLLKVNGSDRIVDEREEESGDRVSRKNKRDDHSVTLNDEKQPACPTDLHEDRRETSQRRCYKLNLDSDFLSAPRKDQYYGPFRVSPCYQTFSSSDSDSDDDSTDAATKTANIFRGVSDKNATISRQVAKIARIADLAEKKIVPCGDINKPVKAGDAKMPFSLSVMGEYDDITALVIHGSKRLCNASGDDVDGVLLAHNRERTPRKSLSFIGEPM